MIKFRYVAGLCCCMLRESVIQAVLMNCAFPVLYCTVLLNGKSVPLDYATKHREKITNNLLFNDKM
jgi:hypothetical protein